MDQRINLKFLGKRPAECLKLLKEVYGEHVMSQTRYMNGTNGSKVAVRRWRMTTSQDGLPQQRLLITLTEGIIPL